MCLVKPPFSATGFLKCHSERELERCLYLIGSLYFKVHNKWTYKYGLTDMEAFTKRLQKQLQQFPLSIAKGAAFCNRESELKTLALWISQMRPIVLSALRRYGETSLALKAIESTKLPYAHIDLFSIVDELDLERLIF